MICPKQQQCLVLQRRASDLLQAFLPAAQLGSCCFLLCKMKKLLNRADYGYDYRTTLSNESSEAL